jgi:hypothetical protein
MPEVLKIIFSILLFYGISFCGYKYWSKQNSSLVEILFYGLLIWFGLYMFVGVNH